MNDIDNLTRGKIHGDESIFVFVIDIFAILSFEAISSLAVNKDMFNILCLDECP